MNYVGYMKRAISNADAFKFTAKPNPVVGALLIKDNQIISQGEHEIFGSCHAEINAIERAKKELGNTFNSFDELTLICTLEPCSHHGQTGPCSDAIIKAGIKKVIVGSQDPNPLVSGKGIKRLIDNGVAVEFGVCADEVKKQNKHFFFKHENKKPYIALKIASSADGKSHKKSGERIFITSNESREDVQILRAEYDAILTGGNTLMADNPQMNARVKFPVNQAKKILLSNKDNISYDYKFFQEADVEVLKERNIHKIVSHIQKSSINSVLVEAGPKLANAFLISGLVDEIIIYKSPNEVGDDGVNWFDEETTVENFGFTLESTYKIDSDIKKIYKKC